MPEILRTKSLWLIICWVLVLSCSNGSNDRTSFDDEILKTIPDSIPYRTDYGGHLQGMATDYEKYLFWSHTVHVVKTDLKGNILYKTDVPSHHGDLAYYKNKIYVAVNLGLFNEKPGLSDSWIYVYDSEDLGFIRKFPVPEVVHGAGGIAIFGNKVMVVGGLPDLTGYESNFVYEYDPEFNLKKVHNLPTGYTRKGIQTAAWFDGHFYFGCYSSENNPDGKVLKAKMAEDGKLKLVAMFDTDMSFGIIGLRDNSFLCSNKAFNFRAGKLSLPN